MARRRIGQESFGFGDGRRGAGSSLDDLAGLIDWAPVEQALAGISNAARGELAWPPLAPFKALLLSVWHDLSDVRLAEALDDRGSFRRFCGFCALEPTPERTAFVRFRKALTARVGQGPVRRDHRPAQGAGDPGEDGHAGRCDHHRLRQ
jgi:IS5 family transposase